MITKEQVEQYHLEGYTIVENVFADNELDPVLSEFEEIVNEFAERAFINKKIKNKISPSICLSCLVGLELRDAIARLHVVRTAKLQAKEPRERPRDGEIFKIIMGERVR